MADSQASNSFSNAISNVGNVIRKYEPFPKEKGELEETFYAAGGGLFLINNAMRTAQLYIPEAVPQAVTTLFESFKTIAAKLETVFNKLSNLESTCRR